MAKFLIESPHTNKGCLEALDEMLASDPKLLVKFDWACKSNFHTGWALVEAQSEGAVRKMLPISLRSQARIFKIDKFTATNIRQMHKK